MSIFESLVESIKEYKFKEIMRKQKSVTKLFPTFYDRVKAVGKKGGIRMKEMFPDKWHYTVASGTKEGVHYDVYIRYRNIIEMVKKYVPNQKLWKQDKSMVDYRLLAAEVLNGADFETSCSCPASLFWGPDFIRTARTAQYGKQEYRPPVVRNKKQYGSLCKHGELVFELLPMYTTTFASFLKKFYSEEVQDAFELAIEEIEKFKKAGEELGKLEPEPTMTRPEEGEEEPEDNSDTKGLMYDQEEDEDERK